MEETLKTYRDEIVDITYLINQHLVKDGNSHYRVRGRAYDPHPTISVETTDIDYIDGTTLSQIVEIVEKNQKKSWHTYSVTGCKLIVTTATGTMIDAYGMRLTFNFYEHQNPESK